MMMDPGSDDEDDTVDIVRLTDKSQGAKAIYPGLGPRRGNPSPVCLLVNGVSTDYKVADGFGRVVYLGYVPSQVPPPSLL